LFSTLLGSGIIIYLTKTYFSEKIKQSIKNEYDEKIEKLRGDINQNHSLINSILNTQNQNNLAVQNERINAITVLWNNYLKLRKQINKICIIDFGLTKEELSNLFTKDWKGNDYLEIELKQISLDNFAESDDYLLSIEEVRPFLNESLWLNLFFLAQFYVRIIFIYSKASKERKFTHWINDEFLVSHIKTNLTEVEFKLVINSKFNNTKLLVQIIEQKILFEINNILEGKIIFNISIDNIKLLTELSILKNKNENTTY
jgi:hypothetical protein